MRGITQYQNVSLAGWMPQENEILAFGLANTHLSAADDEQQRIKALYRNNQLWSVLVNDIALSGNRLPQELKDRIVQLGFWVIRYGIEAMARKLPLEPLLDINRNMADGLRAQNAPDAARPVLLQAAPQAV